MDDVASSEDEKESDAETRNGFGIWSLLKKDWRILRDDFILLRLFAVCGMTFCFAMFFLQIGTSLRSYELLQQYIEERESQYSFLDFYESNEYWSWDPDLFLLTVNTTFYAH
ncbi:uncharacterized protein LOC143054543 [Mytilus galloprovincialis]|uniref:uncharacterized protein LOC143054543 n=1 Tax=Mytilus galloprovincialis TaxID=29158 RepID=UPI0039EF8387